MMKVITRKDELVERTKAKILELFGPESALAQAMEDDDFFDKLGDLVSWLFGEIILSQPRPEPKFPPYRPVQDITKWPKWERSTTDTTSWTASTSTNTFSNKLWAAMRKYRE
jgi:hypothetical protein